MLPASDYFELAISLHKDNLIAVILRNNGITPDATTKRSPADIVNILKMHTKGKEPQLMCDTSKKLLAEVRICFEKAMRQIIMIVLSKLIVILMVYSTHQAPIKF
jgi:hypothetical protein